MRNAEICSVFSALIGGKSLATSYPYKILDAAWKDVLLNQFHDVLPGSSIEKVYVDSIKLYEKVELETLKIINESLFFIGRIANKNVGNILNEFERIDVDEKATATDCLIVFNQLPFTRTELLRVPSIGLDSPVLVKNIPPFSFMSVDKSAPAVKTGSTISKFFCQEVEGGFLMRNSYLEAKFDCKGRLYSLIDLENKGEVLQGPHILKLYEDIPAFWDAWDVEVYHLEKGWEVDESAEVSIMELSTQIISLSRKIQISASSEMTQVKRRCNLQIDYKFDRIRTDD
jgi:alpha-mannosidase